MAGSAPSRLAGILLLCADAWPTALAQTDPWEAITQAGVEASRKGELAAADIVASATPENSNWIVAH